MIDFSKEFTVAVSTERIRQLASKHRRDGKFTSEEAAAFLLLHGQELQDAIDSTIQDFVKSKF